MNLIIDSATDLALVFGMIFAAVFTASWLSLKWLVGYLRDKQIVDRPNSRSMHQGDIPRGGGLVIVFMIIMATLILAIFDERSLFFFTFTLLIVGWAALSWADDRLDLMPMLRLGVQVMLAVATVFLFGWIDRLLGYQLGVFGPILSVLGVLWMANLNNFMDGMDGLAASQAIVASITLGIWFLYLGDVQLAIICLVIFSASYAFLFWNWRPAKIFMGDVGSITVGAIYATLIILAANRHDLPILSLLLIFAVFIVDATITILNRIRRGEQFWLPHRSHFYQRAGLLGISHAKIVMIAICLMTLCSLFASLSVLYRDIIALLLVVPLFLLFVVGYWVTRLERAQ